MVARSGRLAIALLAGTLLSTACGTRLDDSAFSVGAGQGDVLVGGSGVDTATAVEGLDPSIEAPVDGEQPQGTAEAGTTGVPGQEAQPGQAGTAAQPGQPGAAAPKPGAGGAGGGGAGGPAANTASDRGVTPTSIKIGNIVSKSGVFGPEQFTVSYYGAAAYFADLNARGGVNGRKVQFVTCDDKGTPEGNVACARDLIENQKVFAIVASNMFKYSSAGFVNETATPDIGGQPISSEYYQYPHLFNILGTGYPRDGKSKGFAGKYYGTPTVGEWFKRNLKIQKVGVVHYDQEDSTRGADEFDRSLSASGLEVRRYPVSFALPNFDAAVTSMERDGVQAVFDALDAPGNRNLCKAMESNDYLPAAKVSTVSTWSEAVGRDFPQKCRNIVYATSTTRNYTETDHPEVAKFRAAMKRYFANREDRMHLWTLEGWVAAMWFTDAAASCGANLTRACVETFMNRDADYTARGLRSPTSFRKIDYATQTTAPGCVSIARWQDGKSWVTQGRVDKDCYTLPRYSYPVR